MLETIITTILIVGLGSGYLLGRVAPNLLDI